jgi:ApaG protein
MSIRELPGLRVSVDDLQYTDEMAPADKPHRFVYFITIKNESAETVTIRGRKWVVQELGGETVVVEGDGVVGEFPRLDPGESFSYDSSHIVAMDAVVNGSYFGVTEAGERVFTRIPTFDLNPPR